MRTKKRTSRLLVSRCAAGVVRELKMSSPLVAVRFAPDNAPPIRTELRWWKTVAGEGACVRCRAQRDKHTRVEASEMELVLVPATGNGLWLSPPEILARGEGNLASHPLDRAWRPLPATRDTAAFLTLPRAPNEFAAVVRTFADFPCTLIDVAVTLRGSPSESAFMTYFGS